MDIVLLGTGSPLPDPHRAGPATLVKAGSSNILVDCGRGVVMRLAGAGILPPAVSAILVTHMHSDHICALNDLITSHWVMNPTSAALEIYGPEGIRALVGATLQMLDFDVRYRLAHHADLTAGPELRTRELQPGERFRIGESEVTAYRTDHSPVFPTLGYRIAHGDTSAAIAGDTVPCAGLDALCRDAGVYVQTVIRPDLVRQVPSRRFQDILDYHSSVEQAAQTAQRAGVRTLMLTHYVPAPAPGQEDEWREIAARHFSGEIVVGDDLTTCSV